MKRQMKLNYNGFIEHIADVLAAEDIETVQNEAWSIEVQTAYYWTLTYGLTQQILQSAQLSGIEVVQNVAIFLTQKLKSFAEKFVE